MSKTTRLTQQDLQIYPSQRMTDTPDGGGRMVGQPLKGGGQRNFSHCVGCRPYDGQF